MSAAQNVDVSTSHEGQCADRFDPVTSLPLDYSVLNPRYANHPVTAAFWQLQETRLILCRQLLQLEGFFDE